MTPTERAPLNRLDILRGLRISTWEAVWATVWLVLTTGAFQTGFAQSQMGATAFQLGLMAGLPAAVNLLQIPASLYVERRGERRKFVGFCSVFGRLLWIPILLIPFLLPANARLPVFLLLLTLSSALISVTVPAWTSWMSDLVPTSSRGEYFGRRNMLAGIVAMLVPLPAGAFLDQAVKYGRFEPRVGFAVLFGIAATAAIVAVTLILRQPEPPMIRHSDAERPNPLKSLSAPFEDKAFRPFLLFAATVVCGQTLAGQFFVAWQVGKDALSLPYLTVQILGAIASGAGLLTTPIWGYLSDKYGSRPILTLSAVGTIAAPLLWTMTTPGAFALNTVLIVLLNLISGAAWAGLGLTQFNVLLSTATPATRGTYVAVFSATTGIVGAISPILGGALMSALESVAFFVGPVVFNNYKIAFLLTAAIRVVSVLLLSRVPANESHSTRYVLEQLVSARPFTSYLTARRLSRPSGETARRETVAELERLRSPLAVEELTNALDDVSPEVRERAAHALGTIGDARAIPALAAKLTDPAAGIAEIAADALGEIRDKSGVAPLISVLHGPDAGVRVAAIRALARIGDVEAVPALIPALDVRHPTACEAACLALTSFGKACPTTHIAEAVPRLLYLLSQEVDRGMRFAAARAVGSLAPCIPEQDSAKIVYDTLAARLREEADAAVLAQEADALSRLGRALQCPTEEILDVLLPLLEHPAISGLTRKQTLDAIADAVLPPGTFYPYLGMKEMARDEAVSRLLTDLRRRLVSGKSDEESTIAARTTDALDAYTSGDFERFLETLRTLNPDVPPAINQLLAAATRRATVGRGTPEEALLALLVI
jgi:HEAT repeat protein/MFS-type transporter involved in bile tolerance (Atg22 family)